MVNARLMYGFADDDRPILASLKKLTVDESDMNTTDSNGAVMSANFGSDGPGTYEVRGASTFSFTGAQGGQLTSGGSAVAVTVMGNAYVGRANGQEVFRLSLNETTGRYDFTLRKPLDHANTSIQR